MACAWRARVEILLVCVLTACAVNLEGVHGKETLHKKTFKSPGFTLGAGEVIDKYLRVDMPTGHIAVRSLDMNLVAADGTHVSLLETYLHHWVLLRYYLDPASEAVVSFMTKPVPNHGVCDPLLVQYFGLGSEFRHTDTTLPAPYGIVLGDPKDVPGGLEEQWYLNVHAIDTRGVDSLQGCTECLCDVYNVSVDGFGRPLPPGYEGGIFCCHDQTRCPLKKGIEAGAKRELFLEFVVTFVDFSDAVVPVKVYLLDVTDQRTTREGPPDCRVEYTVPKCEEGAAECLHTQEAVAFIEDGGYVVLSAAHMHNGGKVASVTLENGTDICVSTPIYGNGTAAGDEKDFLVGMSTCYPDPKSIYIRPGEKLSLRAVYDNKDRHTGVMGLVLLLIADGPPPGYSGKMVPAALIIVAAAIIGGVLYRNRSRRRVGVKYKPIV